LLITSDHSGFNYSTLFAYFNLIAPVVKGSDRHSVSSLCIYNCWSLAVLQSYNE